MLVSLLNVVRSLALISWLFTISQKAIQSDNTEALM